MKKVLLVILDGLGDLEIKELNHKTPLEAGNTPNLDYMAKNGKTGLIQPCMLSNETYPTSEGAHIGLFGYQDFFLGRGPYEALGINMPLNQGDLALRVNFATLKDNLIVDRRANRIKNTSELIQALSKIEIKGVRFDLEKSDAHRGVLVLRGTNLSSNITSNDPKKEGNPPLKVKGDKRTAKLLNEYLKKAHTILDNLEFNKKREFPANYLLVRGAGKFKQVIPFKEKYGLKPACVAGGGLYKGVARMIGMDIIEKPSFTADIDTDLKAKFKATKKALKEYDFVFLHIKGTDVCSHDGKYEAKKAFIEKIDQYFKDFLNIKNLLIIVTGDHSTPSKLKEHSCDPVPLLIYGGKKDKTICFSEKEAQKGSIGTIKGEGLMQTLDKIIKSKYN